MTNPNGRFGIHGGQYIPETLMNAVIELENAYNYYKNDPVFNRELTELFNEYAGRPSRLYFAEKMTKDLGGARIYLKREDLNHTGAHKINNVLGQALLAKKMGKTRLIAETGAGQHGVATATAAALMDMECVVFMGQEDTVRQALNVYRMRLLGAEVIPVKTGTATLKDAVSEAMREWTSRISDTHYCLGSVMGPHPFPTIVRDFQAVISKEIKEQILQKEGRLPDAVIACVGGGSNAIGSFYHFIEDQNVRLIGCEAAGRGIDGLILPDLPYEEKDEFLPLCHTYGIDLISLIAPTSENRIAMIAKEAEGFLYIVSSLGVTGMRNEIKTDLASIVNVVRQNTDIPCAIGFGISTPEQAKKMAALSDGVIVGSAIIKLLEKYGKDAPDHIGAYVKAMKDSLKSKSL